MAARHPPRSEDGRGLADHGAGWRRCPRPHSFGKSDAATTTERIRRPDYGHLEIELTVDDPKAYTKPWTVTLQQAIVLDTELVDEICLENEKSVQRMIGSNR